MTKSWALVQMPLAQHAPVVQTRTGGRNPINACFSRTGAARNKSVVNDSGGPPFHKPSGELLVTECGGKGAVNNEGGGGS